MGKTKDGSTAVIWDRDLLNSFCDVALKEVQLGNRPTTHFNKEGWANIMTTFKEKTRRDYNKLQLKNKWDQLKKEWKLWKELKQGATGLGWDHVRRTIDAPEEWWNEKLQVVPNAKKFCYFGIEPELDEKLDRMYFNTAATGSHALAPSLTGGHSSNEDEDEIGLRNPELPCDFDDNAHCSRSRHPDSGPSNKRRRHSKATAFEDKLDRMVMTCETICTNSAKSVNEPSSMGRAILLLDSTPEVYNDMELYLFATVFLKDDKNRETLMNMTLERRPIYLRYYFMNRII